MDWITIVVLALCTLLFVSYVWRNYRLHTEKSSMEVQNRESVDDSIGSVCSSPACVRCQSRAYDARSLKNKLLQSFRRYHGDCSSSEFSQQLLDTEDNRFSKKLPRVLHTINSIDKKSDILKAVYRESNCKFVPSCESHPHIWWMPGLKRSPFWDTSDHQHLKRIASVFESPTTIKILQQEYENARIKSSLWKENTIPNGTWRLLHFYDQGSKNMKASDICPRTIGLLESIAISDLMTGCVYGNAMLSVLGRGSQIEAHTGPCNFRLRCHFALIENKNYNIQVGNEVRKWEKGKLMVFDDSFVHRVWHEVDVDGDDDDDRVVLIFDVWHPDIGLDERQSLMHLFPCPSR